MSGLVDPDHGISLAAGKEEIRFRNGSRIFFRARERGALRGVKKIALLVIDEAQHLSDSAMASMLPTQNRAWNPQTIYMGTPPGPRDNGEAFTRLRDKARAGRTHSTLYVEFTADRDADPLDRQQWRKANPSYPAHTSDESIANLWETSPATTSAAKPSASGTNTPSARPSTAANGRKPPSTNAAPAAS